MIKKNLLCKNTTLAGILLAGLLACPVAKGDTIVTTYVTKTQDERTQTRWSLTEWLKIKERMKAMDLWLAIFSDPKKDRFQPELMLGAGLTRGTFTTKNSAGPSEDGSVTGTSLKAQLWLTNLISSTIGVSSLNVDLGAEAFQRRGGAFSPSPTSTAAQNTAASPTPAAAASARRNELECYTGDLRIFGRNIQDSSLVLKYGRYSLHEQIAAAPPGASSATITGIAMGAELQLYLFKALGAEGSYMQYGKTTTAGGFHDAAGAYYDYLGFIEVSLIRIVAGPYVEAWSFTTPGGDTVKTQEKGLLTGLKLQF